MKLQRSEYVNSLDQLMTISCILAGFTFSGLVALPSIDKSLFDKIVSYFGGEFDLPFYCTFYSLFLATLCFISTIMTILIYKVNNFLVPMNKLRRIHRVANTVFSLAIACLMTAVISFGIPTRTGVVVAILFALGIAGSYLQENMSPSQRKKREEQIAKENNLETVQEKPSEIKQENKTPETPDSKPITSNK